MQKIRLHVEATPAREKFIDLPGDWDEMSEDERKEHCADEAIAWVAKVVRYGGEVVDH